MVRKWYDFYRVHVVDGFYIPDMLRQVDVLAGSLICQVRDAMCVSPLACLVSTGCPCDHTKLYIGQPSNSYPPLASQNRCWSLRRKVYAIGVKLAVPPTLNAGTEQPRSNASAERNTTVRSRPRALVWPKNSPRPTYRRRLRYRVCIWSRCRVCSWSREWHWGQVGILEHRSTRGVFGG